MKNIMKSAVFLALFAIFSLECGLPPAQTYGLYNAVLDEYKHLSPFHGFVADQNNVFRYYYDYTLDQEPMQALVHALFRVIDNGLKPHATDREIGSYLGAPEIGALLAVLEKNLDRSTGIITVAPEALKEQLVEWLKTFKMKSGIKAHQKDTFVEIIINALKEAGHWGIQGQHYPQFLVHDIFLTLLYGKVTQKIQFKDYFKQFAGLNNSQGILKSNSDALLEKSYENPADPATMADAIIAAKDRVPFEQLSSYLVEHYEPLGYATIKKKYSGLYPPHLSYGSTVLPWFTNNEILKKHAKTIKFEQFAFSDCMEAAILNVINFIAYDAKTGTLKPIISFFKEFNVRTIYSPAAHNTWAGLVSDIPGAEYNRRIKIAENEGKPVITSEKSEIQSNKPFVRPQEDDGWYYYEIEPTLPNIVKVANKLFNLNLRNFGEFLTHFNLECGSYGATEKEQRQSTCSITDTNKKNCTLSISPGHGEVKLPSPQVARPHDKEFSVISSMFNVGSPHLLMLLNLYSININYVDLSINVQQQRFPFWLRHSLLIQPLQNTTAKLVILRLLGAKMALLKNDPWYRNFLQQILNSLLSLNDHHTTTEALSYWALFASSANMFEEFKKSYEQNLENAQYSVFKSLLENATSDTKPRVASFVLATLPKLDYLHQCLLLEDLTKTKDFYQKDPQFINDLLNLWTQQNDKPSTRLWELLNATIRLDIPVAFAQLLVMQIIPKIASQPDEMEPILHISLLTKPVYRAKLGADFVKKVIAESLPSIPDQYKQKVKELVDAIDNPELSQRR